MRLSRGPRLFCLIDTELTDKVARAYLLLTRTCLFGSVILLDHTDPAISKYLPGYQNVLINNLGAELLEFSLLSANRNSYAPQQLD